MSLTQSVISKIQEFISDRIDRNLCFSSGEIVAQIRQNHPSLVFSASQVGRHITQMWENDEIRYQFGAAERVLRTTTGVGRTPAGVGVYVYGPSEYETMNYNFEVDVPNPTQTRSLLPSPAVYVVNNSPTNPVPGLGLAMMTDSGFLATVHKDGRLCIPPQAFEALGRANGATLKAGSFVYISVGNETRPDGTVGETLEVSCSSTHNCGVFTLSNEGARVRVAATSPKLSVCTPFASGKNYPIKWNDSNNLVIVL